MFYNRDAFRKVGLDAEKAPKTWFELQEALGKLVDAGASCPYTSSYPAWIHVENISAWHNVPVAGGTPKKEGPLAINGMVQVKHLSMMSSWYKSRYLHIFGHGREADARFASGEVAVLTGRPRTATILAREPVTVIEITREDLEGVVREYPEVRAVLERFYKQRAHATVETMLSHLRSTHA